MFNVRTHYRSGRSAHEVVSVDGANNLFDLSGIDWAVSGDDTLIDWGRRGTREVARRVNIWNPSLFSSKGKR